MRIVATSDLHGHLPYIPQCDLLIIAGDILPLDKEQGALANNWLDWKFRRWLEYIRIKHRAKEVVSIGGNHDFFFMDDHTLLQDLNLPWHYLRDSGIELFGKYIYGLPWVPNLEGWAFYADAEKLALAYDAVPEDTDIVVSHGPALGYLDQNRWHPCGAEAANDMLRRVRPELFIHGHMHESAGNAQMNGTRIFNVAYVDISYKPDHEPVIIDLP